jgi:flagellar protein FliT
MAGLSDVLACQRQLASTLAQMIELARARQWQQLPALDAQCLSLVDRLRALEPAQPTALERSRIEALAGRIRADQDQLTELVRPQFVRLMRRMDQLQRMRML